MLQLLGGRGRFAACSFCGVIRLPSAQIYSPRPTQLSLIHICIPKEDLPYIFDKYYRSRADAGKQGSGLGLSICKAILVRHGFAFGAQSEVGRGSLFWFEAPGAPKQERQDKEQ